MFSFVRLGALLLLAGSAGVGAQHPAAPAASTAATRALQAWIALDAPTGDEASALRAVAATDARWRVDAQGSLVMRLGSGRPRRVFACAADRPTYVVSAITNEGYLRLHRAGNGALHPLWDQLHQAKQMLVRTASGAVPGVTANTNGHFARQHRGDTTIANVDQLWVDVGARRRAEAEGMGIRLMDPIARDVPPWAYEGWVAGPSAASRIGCAAVAAVARAAAAPAQGELVFVIAAQHRMGWAGLHGAVARLGGADEVTVVGEATAAGSAPFVAGRSAWGGSALRTSRADSVTVLSLSARFAGTHVESVRAADAEALRAELARRAGTDAERASWTGTGVAPGSREARAAPRDVHAATANMLRRMADIAGTPSNEGRMRVVVLAELPAWARERAVTDSAGNLFVAVGPARDTTVIVAHTDEVGYDVASIRGDGTVALTPRGGVLPHAWEGDFAWLHFTTDASGSAPPSMPGVFVPRDAQRAGTTRNPPELTAWFGLDSAGLVSRGVRRGMGITAYKRAERLGNVRFTGRALDDRAGTTALIEAVRAIDPSRLTRTAIFAWSVYEEGGLLGARALAQRFGASVRRVYAVDTFVSSDTPLELPTFAYTPLGSGPVLRALDDGTISSREERERVFRAARDAGVTLQVGTTHGSTDATPFMQWGAVGAGISWPGRYSHSPGEVLDLRDLRQLSRLVAALAMQK